MSSLLRLYPRSWRARYGEEMEALLDDRRPDRRERVDLIRGALDAWVHPLAPSLAPAITALVGGGLWTVVAAGGVLLLLASLAMLMSWTVAWPGFGAAWTAIGIALFLDRAARIRTPGGNPGSVST